MSLDFGAEIVGLGDVAQKFAQLPATLDKAEQETVRRGSLEALRLFRQNVNPPTLHHRTGHLAQSTNAADPVRDTTGWGAAVGYRKGDVDAYARVQEGVDAAGNYVDSTTIKPKNGKYLWIPFGDALTEAGVPRYSGPGDPAFQTLDATFIFPRGGNPLFGIKDENDQFQALFVGVPSVTIPGRRPLRKAGEAMKPRMPAIGNEEIAKAVKAAGL